MANVQQNVQTRCGSAGRHERRARSRLGLSVFLIGTAVLSVAGCTAEGGHGVDARATASPHATSPGTTAATSGAAAITAICTGIELINSTLIDAHYWKEQGIFTSSQYAAAVDTIPVQLRAIQDQARQVAGPLEADVTRLVREAPSSTPTAHGAEFNPSASAFSHAFDTAKVDCTSHGFTMRNYVTGG